MESFASYDGAGPFRTDAENGDGNTGYFFKVSNIVFGSLRKLVVASAVGGGGFPAGESFVDGCAAFEGAEGGGHLVYAFAVDFVGGADVDGVEIVEDVEFHESPFADAADHGGVAGDNGIEPAAAAGATGSGAEFGSYAGDVFAGCVGQFGGERAAANAGGVGFDDADDAVN